MNRRSLKKKNYANDDALRQDPKLGTKTDGDEDPIAKARNDMNSRGAKPVGAGA